MATSDQMKHLMMVQFSGKKEDYPVFASKFKALCAMKGCLEALEPSFMAQLPADDSTVLDESKEAEAKQIEAKKKNMTAMSYLTFAMSTPQLLAKIEASKSTAWPGGLAYELWAKLEKKYKPKDTLAVAEAMQKLMALKLDQSQDPESLGDEIAKIENAFRVPIDEQQKIAAVVNAGGEKYSDVIIMATNKAGSGNVTADDLIEAMGEKWRIMDGSKEMSNLVLETSLAGVEKKWFPFVCYNCGEKGHRANDCPEKTRKWTGFSCKHCGRKGHVEKDCWDKEENKDKRPKGYKAKKSETETTAAAGSIEILVSCVEMYEEPELELEDSFLGEEVTTESLGSDVNSFDEKSGRSSKVLEVDSFDEYEYVVSSSDGKKSGSTSMYVAESISEFAIDSFDGSVKKRIDSFDSSSVKSIGKEEVALKFEEKEKGEKKMGERMRKGERENLEQGRVLEGDSFARSSDRFAKFHDSSVVSEFGIENKNKNDLSQVLEVRI